MRDHSRPALTVAAFAALFALGACDDETSTADPGDRGSDAERSTDGPGPDESAADAGRPDAAAPDAAPDALQPDGHVPYRPDELPTEGEADLDGPDDLAPRVAEGRARAGRVDIPEEALTGPEARCRVGCFRLDNARVSVCIQDEGTFSQYTFQGGNLVDAHLADRPGTDHLGQHFVAPGAGEVSVESIGIVRDGTGGGPAIVRVSGRARGGRLVKGILAGPSFVPADFRVDTEYRLAPDAAHVDVLTWLTADRTSGQLGLMADVVLFGPRTTRVLIGPDLTDIELSAAWADSVAYGWRHLDTRLDALAGSIDVLPFLPAVHPGFPPMRAGDTRLLRRRFHVAADIEAMRTPPADAVEVVVRGPDGARFVVRGAEDEPITQGTIVAGERALRLGPAPYTLHVVDWPGGAVPPLGFAVEGPVELDLPVPGVLTVHVEDLAGQPVGARIRLRGPDSRDLFVAGEGRWSLPPGEWTAVTTRGWHFAADERAFRLEPGGEAELRVVLSEVIPLDGWASGEFHQHASPSFDSEGPVENKVMSNLAEGVSFMVPSDHDIVFDYAALIERMGLGDFITAPLPGTEVSPLAAHVGMYGIPYDARTGAGGSPPLPYTDDNGDWHIHTIPELVEEGRARGAEIVQINHPRSGSGPTDAAYFNTTGFDPEAPLADNDHRHWTTDFDSVEVFNGGSDMCLVMRDWFGLLNQGQRVTAVGNSDTHGLRGDGHPRNYVPTMADAPVEVTRAEVVDGVVRGRLSVGGGAMVDLPDGPMWGDTVSVEGGVWRVRVRLRTAPFSGLTRLLVFHNGRQVIERPLEAPVEAVVDLDEVLEVPVDADGHVVVVAVGNRSAWIHDEVFALGNPVWVDTDGDGVTVPGPIEVPLPNIHFCQ